MLSVNYNKILLFGKRVDINGNVGTVTGICYWGTGEFDIHLSDIEGNSSEIKTAWFYGNTDKITIL